MINQYLDILILNETRLNDTISDSEISIDKYDTVRRDRSRQRCGVAMYTEVQLDTQLETI
jgi:exonuclease III